MTLNFTQIGVSRIKPAQPGYQQLDPGLPAFVAALAVSYSEGGRVDVSYSDAAIECGDPRYAAPLLDRLAPWADVWSTTAGPTVEGPVSLFLGGLATVLHRYDEADTYFAQSALSSERAHAKYFAARTNLGWGTMLADRRGPRDVQKARDLLTEAHSSAVVNGYGAVERRAESALRLLDT